MSTWQIRVTERRNPQLTGAHDVDYLSPPHDLEHARVLVGLLNGGPVDGFGPWREAVAGGSRLVELVEHGEVPDA